MSITPSSPPSQLPSSSLKPIDYAKQWCTIGINESAHCEHGADFANSELQKGTPAVDIINRCSNWGVSDTSISDNKFQDSATEGYKYGCYLTTLFSGDSKNLCTVDFKDKLGTVNKLPIVCANSCKTIYNSGTQLQTCQDYANQTFESKVDQRGKCDVDNVQSCVYYLTQHSGTYDCDNNIEDRNKHCVPLTLGCTIGQIQSEMLGNVQKQQKKNGQSSISCLDYLPSHKNKSPTEQETVQNIMWPEGPTY